MVERYKMLILFSNFRVFFGFFLYMVVLYGFVGFGKIMLV